MTRDLLTRCRHRIANDDIALGREPSPVLAEIDAVLAEPEAEGAHTADMLAALSAAQAELSALHSLHGEGLEVHGWHLNGAPECLDTFIDDNDNDALGMIEAVLAKAKGGGA